MKALLYSTTLAILIATPVLGKFQVPKTRLPTFQAIERALRGLRQKPTSPYVVAEQIGQIIEGER